jgi:hypothetical protein
MEITSVELFETIRAFDWRKLQGWFNSNVKVSFPDKSGWSIFRLNGPTGIVSPQSIGYYITFGTSPSKHSPIEELLLSGNCRTNTEDFYSTYALLVFYGAYCLSEHGPYGNTCLDNSKHDPLFQAIDTLVLCRKRENRIGCNDTKTAVKIIHNSYERYLLCPEIYQLLGTLRLQGGGKKTRKSRRKTRRR